MESHVTNRYKKLPVYSFPKSDVRKTQDATFWRGLQVRTPNG